MPSSEPASARIARDDDVGDLRLDGARIAADIARLDRKGAALALDHRGVAQQPGNARAVDRRRHDEELQILAQTHLHVAGERQAEIGIERALVEFVEQYRGDAVEHRIVEHKPGENSFGNEFDPRPARNFGPEAHPQAHRVADALVKRRRHALRGRARGEPARLEHQDAAVFRPIFAGENKRHPRGLAGPGRRHQHRRMMRAQRRRQLRQRGVDRERGEVHSLTLRHSGARTQPRARNP